MKINVLGTGMVGQIISQKLDELGNEVFMGTRNPEDTKSRTEPNPMTGVVFADWIKKYPSIQVVRFEDLPSDVEFFINATSGMGSVSALESTGKEKLKDKIILDIANPLDFSKGMPPTLGVSNTDSLGEQIQRAFPESYVVKSLNTLNAYLMVNPALLSEDHTIFMSGNSEEAKKKIYLLLQSFGWIKENVIDLGDITTSRGTEMLLPVWLRLYSALGTPEFNFHVVRK
jgi:hypothetical protein